MEKCFEDLRQDEKHVPDLLDSIIRPTDPVKEEFRQKLFKTVQLESKITKISVCTFHMSGKITDSANVATEAAVLEPSHPLLPIFDRASDQIFKKNMVWALLGLFTLVLKGIL